MSSPDLHLAQTSNLRAALHVSLLLLGPRPFTEIALWEQIAGISYAGDPRMSVPGAENPEKVKNIVRGEGQLQAFRQLYADAVEDVGLQWAEYSTLDRRKWSGAGEQLISVRSQTRTLAHTQQPASSDYHTNLLSRLPLTLRRHIAKHYMPTIVGSIFDPSARAARASGERRGSVPEELDFWGRVIKEERWREVVQNGAARMTIKGRLC